jgi:3-methyladenine DNA glycosylase AlkD
VSKITLLKQELDKLKNPKKAKILQRFFKTRPGEYGEGDIFLGITVPQQRKTAKKYLDLRLKDLQTLLNSKIHEYRFISLLILINQYQKSAPKQKYTIFNFYVKNVKKVNNWDLVDVSAPKIIGDYILKNQKYIKVLYKLAKSKNLWKRRIAILSTFAFIKNQKYQPTLKICKILINDEHDLIHKACGWMLRETGKKEQKILIHFLNQYSTLMPRTMLRYAIEKLSAQKRDYYLKNKPKD